METRNELSVPAISSHPQDAGIIIVNDPSCISLIAATTTRAVLVKGKYTPEMDAAMAELTDRLSASGQTGGYIDHPDFSGTYMPERDDYDWDSRLGLPIRDDIIGNMAMLRKHFPNPFGRGISCGLSINPGVSDASIPHVDGAVSFRFLKSYSRQPGLTTEYYPGWNLKESDDEALKDRFKAAAYPNSLKSMLGAQKVGRDCLLGFKGRSTARGDERRPGECLVHSRPEGAKTRLLLTIWY